MSAIPARESGRPIRLFDRSSENQRLPTALSKLAFIGAVLGPLALTLFGNPVPNDPLSAAFDGPWFDVFVHLLIVLGACIAILSQRFMGASWRIGAARADLGESGPFAISRNAVFLGQAVLFIGLFVVLPSLVQATRTLALLIAIALQTRIEERVLAAACGQPYLDDKTRARRWLGVRRTAP